MAATAFVALLGGACGGDDDDDASTTTTESSTTTTESTTTSTTSSTTTTTPPTPEEQAIAVYNRYWQAFLEAGAIPDPNYPALADASTGGQLARAQNVLQRLVDQGLRGQGRVVTSNPTVVTASESQVVLSDCFQSESTTVRSDTGEVVETSGVVTINYRATVMNEAGTWRVDDLFDQETSCTPS